MTPPDAGEVTIRPAVPADKAEIESFATNTFQWGDYVLDSFDAWLEDENSTVVVACVGGSVRAMARSVQLSPEELWMHAARVHPDFRRRGLGLRMNEAGMAWGKERGAVVARLMVEDWNEAAQAQVAKGGYRRVADWFYASRSVSGSRPSRSATGVRPPEPLRLAPVPEVEAAYMSWATSELARAGHGLGGVRWHMRLMRIEHLLEAAKARHLWEAPSGWLAIEPDAEGAWVSWAMTTPGEADTLVEALMTKLRADGLPSVSVLLPRVPWLVAAFEASGFDVHPNGIWERPIE